MNIVIFLLPAKFLLTFIWLTHTFNATKKSAVYLFRLKAPLGQSYLVKKLFDWKETRFSDMEGKIAKYSVGVTS
jgi:hypothetical protein